MNFKKKIVATMTVDLDDLDHTYGTIGESTSAIRSMTDDHALYVRSNRGKVLCREIAPNTYLGLTSERRRLSLLQIDDSIFIFAPARLSQVNLERMVTQLLNNYQIGTAPEPAAAFQDTALIA